MTLIDLQGHFNDFVCLLVLRSLMESRWNLTNDDTADDLGWRLKLTSSIVLQMVSFSVSYTAYKGNNNGRTSYVSNYFYCQIRSEFRRAVIWCWTRPISDRQVSCGWDNWRSTVSWPFKLALHDSYQRQHDQRLN